MTTQVLSLSAASWSVALRWRRVPPLSTESGSLAQGAAGTREGGL
jgi:hypothetical protein